MVARFNMLRLFALNLITLVSISIEIATFMVLVSSIDANKFIYWKKSLINSIYFLTQNTTFTRDISFMFNFMLPDKEIT